MPLVFAAIIPHAKTTLPPHQEVGNVLERTREAIKELEGELYVMQPDTLFVVSPHAVSSDKSFSINLAPQFQCDCGGGVTSFQKGCDLELVSKIREYVDREEHNLPVNIITQPELDYGTAIALYHLSQHMPAVKVIPVSLSQLSLKEHFQFGEALRYVATQSNKRVAIIASAELGHTTIPKGAAFAKMVTDILMSGDLKRLLEINMDLSESAKSFDELKTLVVLAGALSQMNVKPRILSQENYKGCDFVVAQFTLI